MDKKAVVHIHNGILHSYLKNAFVSVLMRWMKLDDPVVFEIASKYCISDCFVDHDGYSISSEGLLPAVGDIMII